MMKIKKIWLIGLSCLAMGTFVLPCGAEIDRRPERQITSYDEYLDYIASVTLPHDFVYYEDVCELGEFYHFIDSGHWESYRYSFADGVGHQSFRVTKGVLPVYAPTLSEDQINRNDMRTADYDYEKTQSAYYYHDGILYTYINGGLAVISWQRPGENLYYEIFGNLSIYGDFMDTTAIGKLMNLDTAKEMADLISEPYDRGEQGETTTADPSSNGNGVETEAIPDVNPGKIPGKNPGTNSGEIPGGNPSVEMEGKRPTWFENRIRTIPGLFISLSAVGVGVTFAILSLKGRHI